MTDGARPTGRPTGYNEEIAAEICSRMAEGLSLREICRDPAMPAASTVFLWLGKYPIFSEQYSHACVARSHVWAEEIVEISDDGSNDWMDRHQGESTVRVLDHEHVTRSRLRVDTRKWLLAKLQPKKYGERTDGEGDAEASQKIVIKGGLPSGD